MTDLEILPGDLFLINSNKTGPKIVKFLMTAPTIWHHIYRKFKGIQEKPLYYHVGLFFDKDRIIEQQWKVVTKKSTNLLNRNEDLLIVRFKDATLKQRIDCATLAIEDMNEKWDILNAIGKFLTWLTGIKLFARYIEWPDQEICVNRVAYWWLKGFGEKFGVDNHSELTTHSMYKYIMNHPEKFKIVYKKIKQ